VPTDVISGFCLAAALLSLGSHLLFEQTVWPQNSIEWLAVAGLGLLPLGAAFYTWDYGLKHGDIMGHEFMGEVVDVGSSNKKLKIGDRVVVPFTIACDSCFFCKKKLFSLCDTSNPNAELARKEMGQSPGRNEDSNTC